MLLARMVLYWVCLNRTNPKRKENNMGKTRKVTLADRASNIRTNLVLRDFTIIDPDEDDNPNFTLVKHFEDGSKLQWLIAMSMRDIILLCNAEGIGVADAHEHVFKAAPIRLVTWSGNLEGTSWYALFEFPGKDAKETDLLKVEMPSHSELTVESTFADGPTENDWM